MNWVMLAIGAALSWGLYGPMLHKGQVALGNPMRALLCVGVAYLLVAILIPGGTLVSQGQLQRGRDHRRDNCRRPRRLRRNLRHLGVPRGRRAQLRDADRLRLRAIGERLVHDVFASAQGRPESPSVRGVPRDGPWRGNGAILQAARVGRQAQRHEVTKTHRYFVFAVTIGAPSCLCVSVVDVRRQVSTARRGWHSPHTPHRTAFVASAPRSR
jgi:hypothetical protein